MGHDGRRRAAWGAAAGVEMMWTMGGPHVRVLDVVRIGDHPALAEQGLGGRHGAITEIRRYTDGRVRYSVGGLGHEDLDIAGLYDEENLLPTLERADAGIYRLPGPFRGSGCGSRLDDVPSKPR